MILYPAIDTKDGSVVRAPGTESRSPANPVELARSMIAAGAGWLHVVDMDRAFDTGEENLAWVAGICALGGVSVQVGGNVSDETWARDLAASGARRIVFSTAVALDRAHLEQLVAAGEPAEPAIAVEVRGEQVTVRGEDRAAGLTQQQLVGRALDLGIDVIVHRDLERDGMLSGANLDGAAALVGLGARVIAAGGVGSLNAITEARQRGLDGVIVGRALREGRFTLTEAIACSV